MAARVRILNQSMVGFAVPSPAPTVYTAAWDLETDWEPVFARRKTAQLQQFTALVPQPRIIPRGWTTFYDHNFIKRRSLPSMPFVEKPPLPSVQLTMSADTNSGVVLNFASVPRNSVQPGQYVFDRTDPTKIAANTKVVSTTATTVTIDTLTVGTAAAGNVIYFTF